MSGASEPPRAGGRLITQAGVQGPPAPGRPAPARSPSGSGRGAQASGSVLTPPTRPRLWLAPSPHGRPLTWARDGPEARGSGGSAGSGSACGRRTGGQRSSLDARPQEAPPARLPRRGPPRRLRPPLGGFLSPRQGEGPRPPLLRPRPATGPHPVPRGAARSRLPAPGQGPLAQDPGALTLMSSPQLTLEPPGSQFVHPKMSSCAPTPYLICTPGIPVHPHLNARDPDSAPPRMSSWALRLHLTLELADPPHSAPPACYSGHPDSYSGTTTTATSSRVPRPSP